MIRKLITLSCFLLINGSVFSQVDLTAGSPSYSQNFDALVNTGTGNTWTDNSTLSGWYSSETTYNAGTGSAATGTLYSFGSTSASDRTLGSLASGGSGTIYYGLRITNNTGVTLSSIDISYVGEQWRETADGANTLAFSYQIGATDLTSGSWITHTDLDFVSPHSGLASGALDGNLSANQTALSSTISVSLSDGAELWVRWEDVDDAGSDAGLGIDDITVTGCSSGEPTNHLTSFAQNTLQYDQLSLSWTDAVGAQLPSHYLIKGSTVSFAAITDPVNTVLEVDNTLITNIIQGTGVVTFTGLTSNTTYFFKAYPYTCGAIDYKTDGVIPEVSLTTLNEPEAWINEIHYDNVGTDTDELIEIAVNDIGGSLDLTLLRVDKYNGANGETYEDELFIDPDFVTGSTGDGITLYSYNFTANTGSLQNGPDGIAISYDGTLIQFLSYEGSFIGAEGIANGVTSTDIGVVETNTTTVGTSMQLTGSGSSYTDYTWTTGSVASEGSSNSSQTLPVTLTYFKGTALTNSAQLAWQTASEIDNEGFEIQKSTQGNPFQTIGYVSGSGNSNEKLNYSFEDHHFSMSSSYRLNQIDFDGQSEMSDEIFVAHGSLIKEVNIAPMPLSSQSRWHLKGYDLDQVMVQVYNSSGRSMFLLARPLAGNETSILQSINALPKGVYVMEVHDNESKKLIKILR